jgi:hydrogenase/urease accessory protein HupE
MRSGELRRSLRHPLVALSLLLAVVAVGVEGATIPHAHKSPTPGLFNEEHDLTNLATSRGGVTVPDAVPTIARPLVVAPLVLCTVSRPAATPCRQFDSRAPPAPLA